MTPTVQSAHKHFACASPSRDWLLDIQVWQWRYPEVGARTNRFKLSVSSWDCNCRRIVLLRKLQGLRASCPKENQWVSTRTSANFRKSCSKVATGVSSAAAVAASKQSTKWTFVFR